MCQSRCINAPWEGLGLQIISMAFNMDLTLKYAVTSNQRGSLLEVINV